tara:strand:+ start:902 stop:1108 length:207 start_codon:yes stop_codon:yes gene_type:complete
MTYHQFRDDLGEPYGSFEVFYDIRALTPMGKEVDPGWYWWACFPGCMPDGDPAGPFESEQDAIDDALA